MKKEIIKILEADINSEWEGDNALQGLQIIMKYIDPKKKDIIQGAGHDVIYSVDIDEIIKTGLTLKDAEKLRKLNWMIQDDCLACFV